MKWNFFYSSYDNELLSILSNCFVTSLKIGEDIKKQKISCFSISLIHPIYQQNNDPQVFFYLNGKISFVNFRYGSSEDGFYMASDITCKNLYIIKNKLKFYNNFSRNQILKYFNKNSFLKNLSSNYF